MTGTRPAAFGREELRDGPAAGRGRDNTLQTTYSNSLCTLSPRASRPRFLQVLPQRAFVVLHARCSVHRGCQPLSFDETLPELRSVVCCPVDCAAYSL